MGGLLHLVQRGGDWARGRSPPRPLFAVSNVTAHPSSASVPTSYYLMWHTHAIKGLIQYECLSAASRDKHRDLEQVRVEIEERQEPADQTWTTEQELLVRQANDDYVYRTYTPVAQPWSMAHCITSYAHSNTVRSVRHIFRQKCVGQYAHLLQLIDSTHAVQSAVSIKTALSGIPVTLKYLYYPLRISIRWYTPETFLCTSLTIASQRRIIQDRRCRDVFCWLVGSSDG